MTMSHPSAAYRRHHAARIKQRVRSYLVCDESDPASGHRPTDDPRRIGMMARTRKPCSGPCCGNPRKWWGERTVQERRWGQPLDED
jgi:hypothetical protein